jgi:hypothetical protein
LATAFACKTTSPTRAFTSAACDARLARRVWPAPLPMWPLDPNAADRERARKLSVPLGGDIYIHGLPNGHGFIGAAHRARDWTDGCITVTDQEIEDIWKLADNGTSVEIDPRSRDLKIRLSC